MKINDIIFLKKNKDNVKKSHNNNQFKDFSYF